MTEDDRKHMEDAIGLAESCEPLADRIPMVGAVIAIGGVVIGRGKRGNGTAGDNEHAEFMALEGIQDRKQVPQATLYTTLEPCTKEVRSEPSKSCTELIMQHGLKKVFIGILDPNQGVTGKGLWKLQSGGIDVELFPPELAKRLRAINHNFIRVQQTLGIQFTNLESGQTIRTWDKGGAFELEGTFLNPPGADVFAFTGIGGKWWPQPNPLRVTGNGKWAAKIHFGAYGPHTVCIVRASDLGMNLVRYYQKITRMNSERELLVKEHFHKTQTQGTEILKVLEHKYPGIEMGALPKGIEVQSTVEIIVESRPATAIQIDQVR